MRAGRGSDAIGNTRRRGASTASSRIHGILRHGRPLMNHQASKVFCSMLAHELRCPGRVLEPILVFQVAKLLLNARRHLCEGAR